MLDHRYWQSAFAGDPDVVGRRMRVGGRAYTVIGVGPPDFAGTVRGLTPTFYVLTETTLLSLLAGGAGVGLAVWLLDLLVTADLPLPTPVTLDLGLDGSVLGFTFGVSVVAGTLLGLVPALQLQRRRPAGYPARGHRQ